MANNKWVAWVAVIALILAVVALAVVLNNGMTGNSIFSSSSARQIKANSCDADDRCDTQNIVVAGKLTAGGEQGIEASGILAKIIKVTDTITSVNTVSNELTAQNVVVANTLTVTEGAGATIANLFATRYLVVGNVGNNTFSEGSVTVQRTLKAISLSGTGNAYACLNSNGELYRSTTACR